MPFETRPTLASRIRTALRGGGMQEASGQVDCCIPGDIRFGQAATASDGLVLGLSATDLLFREAASFVMERASMPVRVSLLDMELAGTIVSTSGRGYVVRLARPLDPDVVESVAEDFGLAESLGHAS